MISARRKGFARGLTTESKLNHARSRASALGYDIRMVRADWGLTSQAFGAMMGMGMLGALTVERWELGLEKPPHSVEVWVLRQREGLRLRRRLSTRTYLSPFSQAYTDRLARLRRLGPVRCGQAYFERRRQEAGRKKP